LHPDIKATAMVARGRTRMDLMGRAPERVTTREIQIVMLPAWGR
jgi:hypothetical protein